MHGRSSGVGDDLDLIARLTAALAAPQTPEDLGTISAELVRAHLGARVGSFVAAPPVAAPGALAVPVYAGTAIAGTLRFEDPRAEVLDERAARLVEAVAAVLGIALDRARLTVELEAQRDERTRLVRRTHLVNEATDEGHWYWDVVADTVEWNAALLAIHGVDESGWGGTFDDWFQRLHPDDQPRLAAALQAHLETRAPYRIERFQLRHGDGAYRWYTTAGQAAWGEDGRPICMAGAVRDITTEVRAAEELHANERRYEQILDSVQDMVFCKNERLAVTYANAATCAYYGLTAAELRGLTDVPYNEIDFTQQYNRDDRDVFTQKRVIERLAEPNRGRDGRDNFFDTVKAPIRNAQGDVVELVGVSRDVTLRRRQEAGQGLLVQVSDILARSIEADVALAEVARAIVPAFADGCTFDLADNGASRRIVSEALAVADGDARLVVAMTAHGRTLGAITLVARAPRVLDAHDRALAEELARRASGALENALLYRKLRELNASLEQRVAQRTAALTEANAELEAFSYMVSHDLRAPVRHVGAFADLLQSHASETLDDTGRHYIDRIKVASAHMGMLVDGLLTFSRLGRVELAKRPTELLQLVAAVRDELELELRGRTITWEVGDLPTVVADPTLLRVVMSNLIGNAVKYTRTRADAVIAIGAERRADEDVIWVRDNGAGFEMQYADKLFGMFQRLHSDAEFEGTGVGLASARRAIVRHGGRIWADSAPSRGATFAFALPRDEG